MSESEKEPTSLQDGVISSFIYGEWVLIDGEKSGQIIDFHGENCTVDENGMWNNFHKDRLKKDQRYLSPSKIGVKEKKFQKVVWDEPTACCNYQDLYSHGNREWCESCGHVFNY